MKMSYGELKEKLETEQNSLNRVLQQDVLRREQILQKLNTLQGKIRTGVNCPLTAEELSSQTIELSDNTYADLQRILNRQKKILSLYRKQFSKISS